MAPGDLVGGRRDPLFVLRALLFMQTALGGRADRILSAGDVGRSYQSTPTRRCA